MLGDNHPLQVMFYGQFVKPPVVETRVHRIGFASHKPYIPPVIKARPQKSKDEMNLSEKRMFSFLKKQAEPISSFDIAPKLGMTRNHCGILLTSLFRRGLLVRTKATKSNTRFYMYKVKDAS